MYNKIHINFYRVSQDDIEVIDKFVPNDQRTIPAIIQACKEVDVREIKNPVDIHNIPSSWNKVCLLVKYSISNTLNLYELTSKQHTILTHIRVTCMTNVVSKTQLQTALDQLVTQLADLMSASTMIRTIS